VANVNILTGTLLGICSLAAILWMLGRAVEIVTMSVASADVVRLMMVYYLTAPVMEACISAIVCGINIIIGIALYLKWKEPQSPPRN